MFMSYNMGFICGEITRRGDTLFKTKRRQCGSGKSGQVVTAKGSR